MRFGGGGICQSAEKIDGCLFNYFQKKVQKTVYKSFFLCYIIYEFLYHFLEGKYG